ncbi:MAG: O-antigen ligase family protein [Cetobacterium sp.]
MEKLLFLGILFSGGDHLAIKIGGSTFKIAQLFFLAYTMILIFEKKYVINKKVSFFYFGIVMAHLISLFITYSFNKSFLYFIFIIFNYFCVINTVYSWCINKSSEKILELYMKNFRIVGFLVVFQFIFGSFGIEVPFFQNDRYLGIYRPALWFYEPSYLATYFSFYYAISLGCYSENIKKYEKDLILSVFFIGITTSSTGFLSIGIGGLLFIFFMNNSIKISLLKIWKLLRNILMVIIVISITKYDIIKIFLFRLINSGISESSGNRVNGWFEALEVFKKYPIFGIGADAFTSFHSSKIPVTNVSLEILTNLGIFGFFMFFILFCYLYILYKINKKNKFVKIFYMSLILFLITLQANQNYMRMYLWIHIALFISIVRNIDLELNSNITEIKNELY